MFSKFRPGARAIVGINFDEHTDEFIEAVVGFAKAAEFKITLVHAWENRNHYTPISAMPYMDFSNVLFESELKALEEKMAKVLPKFSGLDVTSEIKPGLAPQLLEAEAISSNASLIILGAHRSRYSMLPNMFSTALELTASSPVSTMVIPTGCKNHWLSDSWKLLVADDLRHHSWPAIHLAGDICTNAKGFEFHHFHAHQMSKEEIKETAESIMELMATENLEFDQTFNQETYLAEIQTGIETDMKGRMGAIKNILENTGGRYHEHIRFGKVQGCLEEAIKEVAPHIIVLGRHEAFHRKPFGLGKLPFYALLTSETPVIIAV